MCPKLEAGKVGRSLRNFKSDIESRFTLVDEGFVKRLWILLARPMALMATWWNILLPRWIEFHPSMVIPLLSVKVWTGYFCEWVFFFFFFNNKMLEIGIHIIKMVKMQESEDIAMNTRGVKNHWVESHTRLYIQQFPDRRLIYSASWDFPPYLRLIRNKIQLMSRIESDRSVTNCCSQQSNKIDILRREDN